MKSETDGQSSVVAMAALLTVDLRRAQLDGVFVPPRREPRPSPKAAECRSSYAPNIVPSGEFRGTDPVASEIAFVQACKFGLCQRAKALAVVGIDLVP